MLPPATEHRLHYLCRQDDDFVKTGSVNRFKLFERNNLRYDLLRADSLLFAFSEAAAFQFADEKKPPSHQAQGLNSAGDS